MCYQTGARPPLPPIAVGAGVGSERELVLTAADGNRFSAHAVTTDWVGDPGIVVLPDVRGLHPFYRELAFRFAQAGVHACAIDYFGRTAGIGPRGDDFDFRPHVEQTRDETVAMDVAAAVAHLRGPDGGGAASVFTVGFCFGGRNSFNQAARGHGLAGVIGFYGRITRQSENEEDTPAELVDRFECPVVGLFGGADPAIAPEDVEAFGHALDRAGVSNELVVYEGAPHSFFDRAYEQHREACDDAWGRVLRLVHGKHA